LLPGVEIIRGFAYAAGFAAARRCLRFLDCTLLFFQFGPSHNFRLVWISVIDRFLHEYFHSTYCHRQHDQRPGKLPAEVL